MKFLLRQLKHKILSHLQLIGRKCSKSARPVFLNFRISGKRIHSFRKYFLLIWTPAKGTICPVKLLLPKLFFCSFPNRVRRIPAFRLGWKVHICRVTRSYLADQLCGTYWIWQIFVSKLFVLVFRDEYTQVLDYLLLKLLFHTGLVSFRNHCKYDQKSTYAASNLS